MDVGIDESRTKVFASRINYVGIWSYCGIRYVPYSCYLVTFDGDLGWIGFPGMYIHQYSVLYDDVGWCLTQRNLDNLFVHHAVPPHGIAILDWHYCII